MTLNLLKNMIGKNNDKSGIPLHFKHNNAIIKDPYQLSNAFCNFFTNVGPNHATACITSIQKTIHILSSELP